MHKRQLLSQNALRYGSQLLLPNGNSSLFSSFLCRSTIFVSFSEKENRCGECCTYLCDKTAGGRFSQAVSARQGTICTSTDKRISGCPCENCMDDDSNLKKCGIVHKAPTEPQSLAERTTPQGIPPPILWVVSKCALRESSKAAKAYAFNRSSVFNRLFSSIFKSSSSIV